jgi:hypothetical protein
MNCISSRLLYLSTNWVLSQVTSGGSVTYVHILTYSWSHNCFFYSFHCQRDLSTAYFQNHNYSIFSFLLTLSNYFTYFLWWHRYHVQMCLTASPSSLRTKRDIFLDNMCCNHLGPLHHGECLFSWPITNIYNQTKEVCILRRSVI